MVVTGMELLIGCLMVKKISAAGRYIDGTLFSIDGLGISNNQTDTQGKKSLNRKAFYLRLHHPAATNTGDETVYLIIVSEERNCESIASGPDVTMTSHMEPQSNADGCRKLKYLNKTTIHYCYIFAKSLGRSDMGYNPCFWEMLNSNCLSCNIV
jgi:hypothetical protein